MIDAGTRLWKEEDDGPRPPSSETVDPLEAGCAKALAHAMKHDTDSDYATMAAREFLVMWRFVESRKPQVIRMSPEHAGIVRQDERKCITTIIQAMITERLRYIGLLADYAVKENALVLAALQEVLDAINPPSGPIPPPVAAREKVPDTSKTAEAA